MRNLSDCYLYGILDLGYIDISRCLEIARAMIMGGVDLIQLRGKQTTIGQLSVLAADLHKITAPASIPLVINDHAEVARRVPVEGVHVGQDDESVASVRAKVGRALLVGKSTHSVAQATAAQDEGADYIGFGPIHATPTKPDYVPVGLDQIQEVNCNVTLPIFCIGGIKRDNLPRVLAAGAKRVVIVSGLLQAENITEYAQQCKSLLTANLKQA